MPEIQMPKLSDTMTEGTLVAWKKKKGDQVSAGEVLAEIETDKATMEWESPEDGTLTEIYIEEGGKVNVGDKIAFIGGEGEEAPKAEEQEEKDRSERNGKREDEGRRRKKGRKAEGAASGREREEKDRATEGGKERRACRGRRVACAAGTAATTARGSASKSVARGAANRGRARC